MQGAALCTVVVRPVPILTTETFVLMVTTPLLEHAAQLTVAVAERACTLITRLLALQVMTL